MPRSPFSTSSWKNRLERMLSYGLESAPTEDALLVRRVRAFGLLGMAAVFTVAFVPSVTSANWSMAGAMFADLLLVAGALSVTHRVPTRVVRGGCHLCLSVSLAATVVGCLQLGGASALSVDIPVLLIMFASHLLGVRASAFWTLASMLAMTWVVFYTTPPLSGPGVKATPLMDIWLLRAAVLLTTFVVAAAQRRFADRQSEDLKYLAQHDSLTRLLNRAEFDSQLSAAVSRADRYEHRLALIFIDLDGFKRINDKLGHQAGDAVLRELAARLRFNTRQTDIVGRMGGDEMVVVLDRVEDEKAAERYAHRLLGNLRVPVESEAEPLQIGVSLGLAIYPEDASDERSLLHAADLAMYEAKAAGGDAVQLYSAVRDHLVPR